MVSSSYITTSWDDGHPSDLRVAELLARYGLPGTFYVPRNAPTATLSPEQIRELSRRFEIGAHTLDHVILTKTADDQARRQILASKAWIEELTGRACPMFCAPQGKFAARHLRMMEQAGYAGLRTVELLSLDFPRTNGSLHIVPTTMQFYPHGPLTYVKNTLKRRASQNLWNYVRYGHGRDLEEMAAALLQQVQQHGGVFHLWGHCWELDQLNLWRRLEAVLKVLSEAARTIPAATNGQLCLSPATTPAEHQTSLTPSSSH